MKTHVWIAGCLFTIILTLSAASTGVARPKGDTWEVRETPMPSQRVGFATSAVNGKIFVVGGTLWDQRARRGKVLRTVEEYDPETNRWKPREDMRIGRSNLASSAVNGKIYAIGGSVQMLWTRKHVEKFDPATDTWEKKTDMLEPRSTGSAHVVDGKIYVFGGARDGSAEAYDPVADSWQKKAPVPKQRWGYGTSVVDGKIYAIGGRKLKPDRFFATVEVYDPATDTWEKRADMPTARCCVSANSVNGIIYAISGLDESGILKTVEAYDPTTDTWEQLADMPEPRAGRSEVVDGKIFLFSGGVVFARSLFIYTPPFRLPRSVNPTSKLATTWGQVKMGR